jgi:hypothetical protein
MEALGGYATSSSSSDDEDDESTESTSTANQPGHAAAASHTAGGAGTVATAAAEAARVQRVTAMEKSDSDDSDASDDSDDSESEPEDARGSRLGDSTAGAVALPSASDLMAGGAGGVGAGIYHNPYEQQEIHTKRKLGDNEDNTIFKKVQGKKKVYGQGQKPKTNSSVARSWYVPPFRLQQQCASG